MIVDKNATQEVYLLERYISSEYFGELRDTWEKMISHVELCLTKFTKNLPPDYRKLAVSLQPDITWSERVLPNFRSTYQSLCSAYIQLSHGDIEALGYANGPVNDFRGQLDYTSDWMDRSDENIYAELLNKAVTMASNITTTESATWPPLALSRLYSENDRGPLNPPPTWPFYTTLGNVSVPSGASLSQSGIYLPDIENRCPQFLIVRYKIAPDAFILKQMVDLIHPTTKEIYGSAPEYDRRKCNWFLVKRSEEKIKPSLTGSIADTTHRRVVSGDPCPHSGYYFTPARATSRAYFAEGTIMPGDKSEYGVTIWQWDFKQ